MPPEVNLVTESHSQGRPMETKRTFSLRAELLDVLDQQIEMLSRKTFASFTSEEMSAFKQREQKIRDLQREVAAAGAETVSHRGVLSALSI